MLENLRFDHIGGFSSVLPLDLEIKGRGPFSGKATLTHIYSDISPRVFCGWTGIGDWSRVDNGDIYLERDVCKKCLKAWRKSIDSSRKTGVPTAKAITMKERLISKWNKLHEEQKTAADEYQYPLIMNMARIKSILRERYNYSVNY